MGGSDMGGGRRGWGWGEAQDKFPLEVMYELNPELREEREVLWTEHGTVSDTAHSRVRRSWL